MLRCAVPCCVKLCCAVLRCAALCCAVLRCAALCCAALSCFTTLSCAALCLVVSKVQYNVERVLHVLLTTQPLNLRHLNADMCPAFVPHAPSMP